MSLSKSKGLTPEEFEQQIGFADVVSAPEKKSVGLTPEEFESEIGTKSIISEPVESGYGERALRQKPSNISLADFASTAKESLTSGGKAAIRGGLEGVKNIGRGVKQAYLEGSARLAREGHPLYNDPLIADKYRQQVLKEKEEYKNLPEIQRHPSLANIAEVGGELIATAPISSAALPVKGGGLLSRAIKTIGSGSAQGGALGAIQFDPEGGNRIANIKTGLSLGGIFGAGDVAVRGAGRFLKGKNTPEEIAAQEGRVALANEKGLPLTVGEIQGDLGKQRIENILERLPGTGFLPFREKQSKVFQNEAEKIMRGIGGEEIEDFGAYVNANQKKTLKDRKESLGKRFDKADELADLHKGKVQFQDVKKIANTIVNEKKELLKAYPNSPSMQEKIGRDIKAIEEEYLNLADSPFRVARQVRSAEGDKLRKMREKSNESNSQALEYRDQKRIFEAMENDLDRYGKEVGGPFQAIYEPAREDYKNLVAPFKERLLSKTLSRDYLADNLIGSFLKPDQPQLASVLIKNIDKEGKMAVQAALLNKAYKAGMGKDIQEIPGVPQSNFFNGERFANEALKYGEANKVAYDKPVLDSLKGYKRLSEIARRASTFAQNPQTGALMVETSAIASAGYAIFKDGIKALVGISGGMALANLMHSNVGRSLLTRAKNLKMDDYKGWEKLVVKIADVMQKVMPKIAPYAKTAAIQKNIRGEDPQQEE